ncbi:MAG TPA: TIGR01212 family radical SAM protein [Spirochaetes bacterium]|nr:TIGR01212 family radical SAM protein [Spirochaetota bacterium]
MKKNARSEGPSRPSPLKKWHGKPYNSFGDYLWDTYGARVLKLPLNAGLSCPNRDGSVGSRGCVFCGEDGSASSSAAAGDTLTVQMRKAKDGFNRSERDTRYIAYFQAFTNTYAPVQTLKKIYDTAIAGPGITGLMIGTRPDCLPDETLDLIAGYKREGFELWLEIGMQSCHDASLAFMDRGHTHNDTRDAVTRAAARGIPVCVHVILGIPGETWADMMETAVEISSLPVSGVKIHHLHVIKSTRLEELYLRGMVRVLGLREYVSTVCDFIERLRVNILIHRLLGDRSAESLLAPPWGLRKGTVIRAIEEEFSRRGTAQGFLRREKE